MSAVTIFTGASVAATGTGDAVDVSAHAQLRLSVVTRADLGKAPEVDFWLETAPAASGPWTEAHHRKFNASDPPHSPLAWPANHTTNVVLGNVDSFARVRWWSRARANSSDGNPSLYLAVTGVGIPDAA